MFDLFFYTYECILYDISTLQLTWSIVIIINIDINFGLKKAFCSHFWNILDQKFYRFTLEKIFKFRNVISPFGKVLQLGPSFEQI